MASTNGKEKWLCRCKVKLLPPKETVFKYKVFQDIKMSQFTFFNFNNNNLNNVCAF